MVDASNAFNSLNRIVAFHNIHQLCPSFAPILINTYRSAATLYIAGDFLQLLSEEGTTQGDPLAMPMYALAILPLSERLPSDVTQVCYADDACACGSIVQLCHWWECLCGIGLGYGYFVNAENTWLLTKSAFQSAAVAQFIGMGVSICLAICSTSFRVWPFLT